MMGTATFVEDFKHGLEFTPVEGQPNVYLIHPHRESTRDTQTEMTAEDWDKFEKDVTEAFEQVP